MEKIFIVSVVTEFEAKGKSVREVYNHYNELYNSSLNEHVSVTVQEA